MKNTKKTLFSMPKTKTLLRAVCGVNIVFVICFAIIFLCASFVLAQDQAVSLTDTNNRREVMALMQRMALRGNGEVLAEFEYFSIDEGGDELKKTLDSLSGSFLVESLMQMSFDNNSESLYSKVSYPKTRETNSAKTSFWVESAIINTEINHQKLNLLGNTENTVFGLRLGSTFIKSNDFMLGIFAYTDNAVIKQGRNRADAESAETGFYGGVLGDNYEWKFYLSGGWHNLKVARHIELMDVYSPKSDFDVYSVKAGVQLSAIAKLDFDIDLKPYVGLRGAVLENYDIAETQGGDANLYVMGNRYKTVTGFGGLQIQRVEERFSWSIKGEVGYLFKGNGSQSQYDITFVNGFNRKTDMQIRAAEINSLTYGAGFNMEAALVYWLNAYAEGYLHQSANIMSTNISIGFRIPFGAKPFKKKVATKKSKTQRQRTTVATPKRAAQTEIITRQVTIKKRADGYYETVLFDDVID
jgi:hypothetical protein